jgi:monoamine oxidase
MEPLLRVYAVFKKSSLAKGGVWFADLPKIVTDSPLRYIIPIDYKKGVIMISYTDGADARQLMKMKTEDLEEFIMTEIRALFPDRVIPDPVLFKKHPWVEGCTYWLPGKYDVEKESAASLHPLPSKLPGVFLCGESFAVKQCWMESALTQADLLLESEEFKRAIQKI